MIDSIPGTVLSLLRSKCVKSECIRLKSGQRDIFSKWWKYLNLTKSRQSAKFQNVPLTLLSLKF